ncbi:MAG TPA: type IX secretion system protein PorQ [Chitinophagales bacterium]|nr:type IX secretion system protein PorQ [Chitinophagales bacterium]
MHRNFWLVKNALRLILLLFACKGFAQNPVGGSAAISFLNNPFSARVQALGGINQALFGDDVSLGYTNPSAWNKSMHKTVCFGTSFLPGGINSGNVTYAHHFDKRATFGFGMNYMAYGNIPRTDESGNEIGRMNAAEFAWYSGSAYHFAKILSVGANAKLFYSQLAEYSSVGMAADIAFSVNDSAHRISASLVATNIGGQFKPFRNKNYEMLPFDLRLGLAFGFKGFPLRFHFTMHDLTRWNIRYNDPNASTNDNLFDQNNSAAKKDIGDEIFRHIIIGAEANIKNVVRLQLAYNHQRRQELKQDNVRGIAGISFGLGIHIKYLDLQYALNPAALGKTTNHLTFSLNIAISPSI